MMGLLSKATKLAFTLFESISHQFRGEVYSCSQSTSSRNKKEHRTCLITSGVRHLINAYGSYLRGPRWLCPFIPLDTAQRDHNALPIHIFEALVQYCSLRPCFRFKVPTSQSLPLLDSRILVMGGHSKWWIQQH